ncbi:MAG: PHP domain-containing protein [Chloroflexi bacterium]|nr:PHP domain-containing protein [Chloroflexota bacterium]
MSREPRVDLHAHTTASDGALQPAELVGLARQVGLAVLGVTDHDTTDGLPAALAAAGQGLEVVPGVELSTDVPVGEVHVLGYFLDYQDASFQGQLAELREARVERAQAMVERLAELRAPVSWERVLALAGGAVGRPHIAQALVEAGHVASVPQAFDLYLGRGKPAYVEREKLTPAEAVRMLRQVGGVAVVAHPYILDTAGRVKVRLDLPALLPQLCAAGLQGLEVYYTNYTRDVITELRIVAERFGLVATGGSDFHGGGTVPEAQLGAVAVPYACVERLRRLAGR